MNPSPKISIVILNWNGSKFLRSFLPSLVSFTSHLAEIIVADNGSTDDSSRVISDLFPSVRYLPLQQNYGFAEGYNRALKDLNSEYFLILNSDVSVQAGWLEPMLEMMEGDSSIAICQPKILDLNQPGKFEYAGAAGGFLDCLGYPYCRGRILQEIEQDLGQYDQSIQVSWATGACMLVKSSVWREIGGFDVDFWAHMEEIDLCWRVQHLGYKIFVCPESVVQHVGGGTLPYNSPLKTRLNFRNNLYLLFKNLKSRELIKLPVRMLLDGIAAITFLVRGEFRSFISVFLAHLQFYGHLPVLVKKRREILSCSIKEIQPVLSEKSILWNYYFLRRKKYSEIHKF
jgi:GT2 family glycosyltransferase